MDGLKAEARFAPNLIAAIRKTHIPDIAFLTSDPGNLGLKQLPGFHNPKPG